MSVAPTSANISIDDRNAYRTTKVFIFRFEDDATGADRDAKTFSGCMRDVFGIEDVEALIIEKTSKQPGLQVNRRIAENLDRLGLARSLLMIVYIGHAIVDSQMMEWSWVDRYLSSTEDSMQNIDILAVLDCCYAASAVRAGGNRAVQVLASCDRHSTVRLRESGVTFIQRFRAAAYALRNAGNLLVSVESIFGELQRSKPPKAPDAVHRIIGSARLYRYLPAAKLTCLFKLSLAGEPSDVLIEILMPFRRSSRSLLKMLTSLAPWCSSVVLPGRFARLRSTLDCVFIAAVKGASLVPGKIDGQAHDALQMGPETRSFGDPLENRSVC
ncbi:hypothetical protein V1525DRAFT_427431 [Lipomyces kononenkoae]|uniref:Uncharacterized protein n=1 Tax=Lipomyces kononenkoae TaxID=34357 RepID=A0ACC3SWJ7_LIPKO